MCNDHGRTSECAADVALHPLGPGGMASELKSARQLAFVITDMESSTAMAAANVHAFSRMQETHDAVSSSCLQLLARSNPDLLPVI